MNEHEPRPSRARDGDPGAHNGGWIDVKAWKKLKMSPNSRQTACLSPETPIQTSQPTEPPPRQEPTVIFTELTHSSSYVQDAILNHPTFMEIATHLKAIDQHHQPTWANGGLILVEMEPPIDTEGLARICTSKHVILEQQHLGALSQALLTLPSYRRPRLWVEMVATSQ